MPRKKAKATEPPKEIDTKRQTTAAAYVGSTVSTMDTAYRSPRSGPLADIVTRANSWAMICAKANAQSVSDQTLRLYRASGSGGLKARYDRSQRKHVNYLLDPTGGPGRKAASYAGTSRDFVEVDDAPVLQLLRNPNPLMQGRAFTKLGSLYRELSGNEFVFLVQPKGAQPSQLYQMAPQNTRVISSPNSLVESYAYGRYGATDARFAPDEVKHFKFQENPFSPFYGSGPLHDIIQEQDIYLAANANEQATWENGARPDYVISVNDENATEQQIDQIDTRVNARLRGVDKRGRFLIVTNSQVLPLGFTNKDMEYLQGKRDLRIAIFAAFGIPEAYIELNSANLSGALTADTQYLRRTVRPRINQHAEELTEWLLPLFGMTPGEFWFAYDNPVPEDLQFVADRNSKFVTSGILTIDEARADEGYGPLADGLGAVPRVNGVPLEAPNDEPESPSDATGPSILAICEAARAGQVPADTARAILATVYSLDDASVEAMVSPIEEAQVEDEANPDSQPEPPAPNGQPQQEGATPPNPESKSANSTACGHCSTVETKGGASHRHDSIVSELAKHVQAWYERAARDLKVSEDGTVDLSHLEGDLAQEIDPAIREMFRLGGRDGLSTLTDVPGGSALIDSAQMSFDVLPEAAVEYLKTYVPKLAESTVSRLEAQLGDEAKRAIASLSSVVSEGIERGDNTGQVTRAVQAALNEDASWRAERIARSESSRAYTAGRIESWKAAGVTRKRFLLAPDSCPVCKGFAALFNAPHPIDEPFVPEGGSFADSAGNEVQNDYAPLHGPPVHPNCRCTIVPVID